eukprot:7285461-Prymnesium_polylepis.1
MTTVGDDDHDGVALGIAGIAPNALDAAGASASATSTPDGVSGSQCDHDARTAGLRSIRFDRAGSQAAEAPARASRRRGQAAEAADNRAAVAVRASPDDMTTPASDSQPSPAIAQDAAGLQDLHDSEAARNDLAAAAVLPAHGADGVEPPGEEAGSHA